MFFNIFLFDANFEMTGKMDLYALKFNTGIGSQHYIE